MIRKRYTVHLNGEVPVLGSGRRVVEAEVGYKWVRVWKPGKERAKKIRRNVWDLICIEEEKSC
jgi:hypothetical protein